MRSGKSPWNCRALLDAERFRVSCEQGRRHRPSRANPGSVRPGWCRQGPGPRRGPELQGGRQEWRSSENVSYLLHPPPRQAGWRSRESERPAQGKAGRPAGRIIDPGSTNHPRGVARRGSKSTEATVRCVVRFFRSRQRLANADPARIPFPSRRQLRTSGNGDHTTKRPVGIGRRGGVWGLVSARFADQGRGAERLPERSRRAVVTRAYGVRRRPSACRHVLVAVPCPRRRRRGAAAGAVCSTVRAGAAAHRCPFAAAAPRLFAARLVLVIRFGTCT